MRVVQFTDPHLISEAGKEFHGVDTYESLRRALDAALLLNPAPNVIFVTGDLAEDGCAETYSRFKEIFEKLDVPVFVTPGNHDDLGAMKQIFASSIIQLKSYTSLDNWFGIFVNSQVAGKAYGAINIPTLREIEQALKIAEDRPVVVSLHHSPLSRCPSSDCQLQNPDGFLNLLRQHTNVKIVLSGHLHQEIEQDFEHIKLLTSPSTFAQAQHPENSASIDVENFMASHTLDSTRQGFRILDLLPTGEFETKVYSC